MGLQQCSYLEELRASIVAMAPRRTTETLKATMYSNAVGFVVRLRPVLLKNMCLNWQSII
jgi:hypothetical protein